MVQPYPWEIKSYDVCSCFQWCDNFPYTLVYYVDICWLLCSTHLFCEFHPMPASTTQKQQGGACPYRFTAEEFVDYRCTTHYSIKPSTTNHRQNMRRSQIASKQARQRKGSWCDPDFPRLCFWWNRVSLLQMSIYTHYTNILYTVRWSPLPSNNHHQDCLRCCWLGEYPKVHNYDMHVYTDINHYQQVWWISEPLIA